MKPVKVSQLNSYIKQLLQSDAVLSNVSVVGEVSNLKFHSSGHVYFSLKDEFSKINCFLPGDKVQKLRYELDEGMEIVASGYLYLYEKGGYYSLNVRDVEVMGQGSLSIAFDKLKAKLEAEGIFDAKYKKPLPFFPKKLAVITAETGAALQDVLKIVKSRNDIVDILVYPCKVQGIGAAEDIAAAIEGVNTLFPETDVIICGRGGGSAEELWAFNEECVARAIFNSKIPLISAVGHETDFSISDFAADARAETPTAAAQMAVPDVFYLRDYIKTLADDMVKRMDYVCANKEQLLDSYINRMRLLLSAKLDACTNLISALHDNLEALSPKGTMERGFAAVLDSSGKLRASIDGFAVGDSLELVLSDGRMDCSVNRISKSKV